MSRNVGTIILSDPKHFFEASILYVKSLAIFKIFYLPIPHNFFCQRHTIFKWSPIAYRLNVPFLTKRIQFDIVFLQWIRPILFEYIFYSTTLLLSLEHGTLGLIKGEAYGLWECNMFKDQSITTLELCNDGKVTQTSLVGRFPEIFYKHLETSWRTFICEDIWHTEFHKYIL